MTGEDAGHALRVVVTASNAAGDATAASAPTGTVPSPTAPATGQGSTPTPAPAEPDLSTLSGSLVSDRMCQTVTGGRATRRATLPGAGAVLLRVRADTVVAPDSPIRVTVTTPRGRTVAVTATLDGRALALRAGRSATLRLRLRSASCAARYTARQGRRTAAGTTTVRLRVDSRTALNVVSLPLPAALRLQARARPRRVARLRVVVAGGRSRTFALTLPASKRSGALAVTPSGPRVTFGPAGLRIGALPGGTGIVELTESGVAGLAPGRSTRLTARAAGTGGTQTLAAKLRAPRR